MQPVGAAEASLQQYLRAVLSQPGPHAVPYTDAAKFHIEEELTRLRQVFPTLSIRLSEYHSNDGRLLHLLKADGTIPIHYQGNKYNIPIVIWITERFPSEPPLAYVVPTATMVIKAGHPQVDRNGQVACPALSYWKNTTTLVDLCLEMSQLFGAQPPLYSQPGAASAASTATSQAGARPPAQPTVQPPAGYPGFATNPPPGYPQPYGMSASAGSLASPRPPAGNNPNNPTGFPPGPRPQGYSGPIEYPPPASTAAPSTSQAASMAASNPLWGAAFLANQQQAPGARPPFNNPPPPGMASGLSASSDSSAGTSAASFGYPPAGAMPPGYPPPSMYGGARPPPPPPPPQPQPPRITSAELSANFKPIALRALTEQAEAAHKAWSGHAAEEMNALLEDQRVLSEHKAQLQAVIASLKAEREGTEGLVSEMGSKQAQLVAWLERNEAKAAAFRESTSNGENVDWEKVLVPADDLARQAMETQAEDLACEDAVLALDKALAAGLSGLTPDVYLKQVRQLCRKQFFARALGLKVAEMQRKLPPPGRAMPYSGVSNPMPVTHGDTWMHPMDAARVAMQR